MERVFVRPPAKLDLTLRVPGSKSLTNRALVAAALADGSSTLRGISLSDDSRHLADALRKTGVSIEAKDDSCVVTGGRIGPVPDRVDMGNAGTALRFFTSLACLGEGTYVIDGDERMRERPIQGLVDTLVQLGAEARATNGCPPVTVEGGHFGGGPARIEGTVSSQFISSVLLAAPRAKKEVHLQVKGEMTSKPYVDMTIGVIEAFGVPVRQVGYEEFTVIPGQYIAREYDVEADAASANYFFAMAATGGRARIDGLGKDCAQGEYGFLDVLEKMGSGVERGADYTEVRGKGLKGVDVDLNDAPDSVQTLSVLALFADGPTTIRNVANLRVKETDRIAALATELRKFGAKVEERDDGLTIEPPKAVGDAEVETYNDHRMAMSFAVIGARQPVTILNPDCVNKSYPGFFENLTLSESA